MSWQPTLYSLLGVGAAGVAAAVVGLARHHRDERGANSFMLLMLALAGWSLVYAVQLGYPTLAEQLLWQRIGLAVGGTIPTLWFLFALQYSGVDRLTGDARALLGAEPLLFALLTLTNPAHGVIWTDATVASTAVGSVAHPAFGTGYYVHIAYAYLLVAAGLGLLFRVFVRSSRIYRRQTGFLILGAMPPFAANVAFTLRAPWGPLPTVDPTPFAFVVTGVLFGLALFRFDLLRRTPVARRRVLDEMGDGLVVLDAGGRVVNANAIARRVLDPPPSADRRIADVGPHGATSTDGALAALDGRTITATVDGRERAYDVDWSPLEDRHGRTVGHVLGLRDVTGRNRYEQRLEVAQRVLRHNLRNDMTMIRGWADRLAEAATDGQVETAEHIIDTAEDLIDLSEKTQTMVRIEEGATDERTTVDVGDHLAALVDEFRTAYPRATIEVTIPASTTVTLPDEEFLSVPVRNLIENAIEHNDRPEPWVGVRVRRAGDRLTIRVEDDGPEIPAMERRVIEEGAEDPLQHGSGVGLWLSYWSVRTVGGDVQFDQLERRGNVVTLEIPAVDRPTAQVQSPGGTRGDSR